MAGVGSASAATLSFEVSDTRPGELANTTPSSTSGTVVSDAAVPTMTYTVTGVDLTSVGGTASETIIFDIDYSQTNGTGVQVNGFGNISVTGGGDNNQVDGDETLTATVSLNSTTYAAGDIDLGFVTFVTGGVSGTADEQWNIITENGTTLYQSPGNNTANFASSSFVTLDPVAGDNFNGTFNAQGYTINLTATQAPIPEPASLALLGASAMLMFTRRRK